MAWFQRNSEIENNYEEDNCGGFVSAQSRCSEQLICNFPKRSLKHGCFPDKKFP